jgi:hypothetical protein
MGGYFARLVESVQQIQSQAISDEVMGKKKTTFDLREVMPV